MHSLLIEIKIKKDKLEASGRCALKQLFLSFRKLPKIWLQQSHFTFTTPVVNLKGLHYNTFWIAISDIQRSYFREYFSCFSTEAVAQRCFVKTMLFQIFPGKHLYRGLFFNKVFSFFKKKKETLAQVFSCEFCKICKSTFSIEHLRWLLLCLHHIKVIVN